MKEYCDWAGEEVEADEHKDCICQNCEECGKKFKKDGSNKWEMTAYNSVWLHKKCIMGWLENSGEIQNVQDNRE